MITTETSGTPEYLRILAVCGLLFWAGSSTAQAQGPGSQGRGAFQDPTVTFFSASLGRGPKSLDEVIANSRLIVEVTVISAFPASKVSGNGPVSTDFVLAPQKVLKGELAADRFVVNQLGGELEGRKFYTSQYPGKLMRPGQRYILFLTDPARRTLPYPELDGMVRFSTVFSFAGVVLVEQGKVELTRDISFLDSYNGMSTEQFMGEIAARTQSR